MEGIDIEKIRKQKSMQELLEFSILNIDKPCGQTSFWVSDFVRNELRNFGVRKTSHFGTLDPKVTGVLPIALNRACKLTGYFMKKNKTYAGIMRLHEEIDDEKLKKEIDKFRGRIKQLPPLKSRVKREERERFVYSFEIIERDEKDKKNVLFETEVEAGTYIRKLIHDLGKEIGGAHMLELRRTEAGIFSEHDKEFINLYDLVNAVEEYRDGRQEKLKNMLIPGEAISRIMPVMRVREDAVKKLLTGKPIFKDDMAEELKQKDGTIAVFCNNKFIETARIVNEKDIIAKPEFVLN